MLISPPIILARNNGESDDQWVGRCMSGDAPGRGAYPLSYKLEWHGGLHLTAPRNGTNTTPVRAIADGKVIYVRQPTVVAATDEEHPLNYYNGYTSDACVVIEHTNEIGEGTNATVTFFSVYHHLTGIPATIAAGKKIERKDIVGQAGHIYADADRFHFEICCDDANLKKLIGRSSDPLPTSANGRSDVVFGEVFFTIPAGTRLFAQQPVPYMPDGHRQPPKPSNSAPWPALAEQTAVHTTAIEMIVGLRYINGNAELTTYKTDGSLIGTALTEGSAEYVLFNTAGDMVKAWERAHTANAQQYPTIPAISAIYELLRFGRIINTENETLTPATAAHWRRVNYDGGQGWINLNAANVHHFSDADFPPWKGWQLIDDDSAATDSKCDSAIIKKMLDVNKDGSVTPDEAQASLDDVKVQQRLRHTICKFPCEWEEATLSARWSWLKTKTAENPAPFKDDEYTHLEKHLKALCFPCPPLFSAQWRFDPREFIKYFRRCGWLSKNELALCLPHFPGYARAGTVYNSTAGGSISLSTALSRTARYNVPMNQVMRKYGLNNERKRQAHFLAQLMLETDKWQTMTEYGHGHPLAAIPMIQYYAAFYGRGVMQLTWAANYEAYGLYRNLPNAASYVDTRITATSSHYFGDPTTRDSHGHITGLDPHKPARRWAPRYDPDVISSNPYNACDSGGFYWTSKHHDGSIDINRTADGDFTADVIGRVSVLVNGGGNGYYERQAYAQYAWRRLSDDTTTTTVVNYHIPRGNLQVNVNFTPPA